MEHAEGVFAARAGWPLEARPSFSFLPNTAPSVTPWAYRDLA